MKTGSFYKHIRTIILVTANQNPISLILNQHTKFSDISKLISIVWRQQASSLQLFLADGTEIEEPDLVNIKKGTQLYVQLNKQVPPINCLQNEYFMMQKIGEGGQSIVYLGKNKATKEYVAIKKISHSTWLGQSFDTLQQESQILKALDHKNIVKLYQTYTFQEQSEIIMIMEYLKGGSLLSQANSKLTESDAKLYSRQLVDAISYCHENNIVHCDLKLENIMLSSSLHKEIKIIDFGVSNYAGHYHNQDNVIGTLSYLAPEVLHTSYKQISKSQDIWAIGCIIFGLVFGKLPFDGNTPSETYRNILSNTYLIPKKKISKDLLNLFSLIFVTSPRDRININDLQNHSWFKEQPKLFKLNFSQPSIKIGRSSSVQKINSLRKSREDDQLNLITARKLVYSRRSISRLDKISFANKVK